jgi:hypothetical protein
MSKKLGQRKAKVPGSPLKTAITGRATRARVEKAEKAVMAVRRSNRA